jgi:tetratricopeptide (TPR) repeat protein
VRPIADQHFSTPSIFRSSLGRSLLTASAVLLFGLFASSPAPAQTSDDQVDAHFRAGQVALQQGRFVAAIEEFKKVLTLDPTLVEAEVNLGLAYHSASEYQLAVRHLSKALQQKPNLLGANVIAGMDYVKLGSGEKALPFLQHALKLDPSNPEAHQALATAYLAEENFGAAAEEFRKLAALNVDKAEGWFKLGHEYLNLSARLAYRGAHLYRESAWGHRFLADLLYQRNRWDEASREYNKALSANPQQPGLHSSLGHAYLRAGKVTEAETEFHLELAIDSQNEVAWLGLAELDLKKNKPEAALQDISRVWEISPEWLVLQREFPTVELSQEDARAFIKQLRTSAGAEPAAHFLIASLHGIANEATEAEKYWNAFQADFQTRQKADQLSPGSGSCRAHRYARCALLMKSQKHLTGAERLALGKAQFALRDYESAADALAAVAGVSKENEEASYWLAVAYHELGAACYAKLEESFPDSWRAHQLRAEGYALQQELDPAVKEFQAALQLQPNAAELHESLGEAFLNRHSDEDAQRELENALQLDPSRTRALYLLGRIYVQRRENERALQYLQQAVRLQPDLAEANSLLGTTYVRLAKFASAIPALQKAAPMDHYGNVHYQLYIAYKKLGQNELAQKALTRSQDLRRSSLEHDQALIMGAQPIENESP